MAEVDSNNDNVINYEEFNNAMVQIIVQKSSQLQINPQWLIYLYYLNFTKF